MGREIESRQRLSAWSDMEHQRRSAEEQTKQSARRFPMAAAAAVVALLAVASRLPLLSMPGFGPDQAQFILWSLAMQPGEGRAGGVAAAYEPVRQEVRAPGAGGQSGALPSIEARPLANYPPGYLYVLRVLPRWGPAEPEQLSAAGGVRQNQNS
jgi:hypothetical protein